MTTVIVLLQKLTCSLFFTKKNNYFSHKIDVHKMFNVLNLDSNIFQMKWRIFITLSCVN